MRRDQSNSGSQTVRNLLTNPAFETVSGSTVTGRTNLAINPSFEAVGSSLPVRTNFATNPNFETASGTVNVRTNLATNPSFEATSGVTNVRTNFIQNPSIESGSGTVNTRTNLAPNPNAVNSAGWFAANGVVITQVFNQPGGPVYNNAYSRITSTTTATGMGYFGVAYGQPGAGNAAAVVAGTVYTISAYVRVTMTAFSVQPVIRLRWKDAAGATLSDIVVNGTGATSGNWVRIAASGTAPANAAYIEIMGGYVSIDLSTIAIGSTIDMSAVLVEATNAVGPYFDGTIPANENLAKLAATALSGTTITTGISYAGSTWSRATVTAGTGSSIARQNVNLAELQQGQVYTVSVTVANDQAFSQQLQVDWCDTGYTPASLAPGEVRRITFSSSKSVYDTTFRFSDLEVIRSATESRSVLYKDWVIEVGTTAGDYYTGTGDFTYGWTGTSNASTSVQKATGAFYWYPASTAVLFQSSVQKNSQGKSLAVVTKGGNGDGGYASDISGITPTGSYTFSAWVKTTTSVPITLALRFKDAGQVTLGEPSAAVTPTVGVWTRLSWTGVAPANAALLQPMIRIYAAHTATTFFVDDVMVERASGLGTYFDGSTAASGDFTYVWTGTANASTSYQQAPTITGWTPRWYGNGGGNGSFYQAKGGLSGTYARKLWTSANTTGTLDCGINNSTNIAVSPNMSYTVSAYVRASFAQVFNPYIDWYDAGAVKVGTTTQGAGVTLVPNMWTRISISGVSPSAATNAAFLITPYANAIATPYGGTLDFDNVLIEESPLIGAYFDGTSPVQNMCSNPSFESSLGTWNTVSGGVITRDTTQGYVGTACAKIAVVNAVDGGYFSGGAATTDSGMVITTSAYFKAPVGMSVRFDTDTSTDGSSWVVSNTTTHTATGDWQRVNHTTTMPAGTTKVTVGFKANTSWTGNILVDAILIEVGPTLNPYYEGTGDFTYVWSGTANASTSYAQAPGLAGYGGSGGSRLYQINRGTLGKAGALLKMQGYAYATYNFTGLTQNTTYTVSVDVTTPLAAVTMVDRGVSGQYNAAQKVVTPNVTTRINRSFTTGTGETSRNFSVAGYEDGEAPNGTLLIIDRLLVEEYPVAGTYFDGANPIQNLATDPMPTTLTIPANGAGWSGTRWFGISGAGTHAIITGASDGPIPSLTSYVRKTWTTGWTTGDTGFNNTTGSGTPVVGGTTYTISSYLRTSAAGKTNANIAVSWRDSTGNTIGGVISGPMQSLTANVWTRISYTTTAPVNAAYAVIYSDQDGGTAWVAGDTLDGTGLLIEKSDTLNQYYVGLGDFTYVWTGTANASTSQQKAFIPASTTASNGSARVSSNGLSLTTKSVRVVPTSSTSDTFVEINGFTFQMSKTYTISATLTMLAPQTGSLDTRARKVQVYHSGGFTVGTQAPNVAGSFRSSVTLTITDETQYQSIRLYNGASAGGGDVWWDDILIEESASVLPYFDGSTPAGNDFTYVWSGTANASTSLLKAVPVISVNAFYTNRAISRSSTQWSSSGTKSLRITPIGATNDTFADIAGLLPPGFQFKPNATYTISGTKYTTSSLVSYGNMGFRVNIGVDGEKSPSYRVAPVNTPGVQKLSATFTTGSGGATNFLRVYGGTAAGNGDSWWDDLMLVEGDYTGDYIDGTKPFSKWDGTAHASTSVGYPPQFLDIAGKPELDLDSSTTTLTLPDTLGLTEARTFYTVYVTTQDITSGVFSILTYGSTALNDTVPNSFLTLRQEASAGPANIVRVRRTLGAGPQALNAFGGINVTCWGMDGSGNLFLQNGNNTEQAEVFPVSVPHQKIMYTTSGYHTHTRTIMYRGQHDLATRAAISRYLGNKYGGAVA